MAIIRGTYVTKLAGKVGNVVYRNRGGQNIASEKPATVKNPRSDAQQRQRMVFATVSAAYSAMKEICDHSFEGITYGADNMAEFMRRNLSIMKSRTKNFNAKGNPYIVPNPFMISRGSLPTIPIDAESVAAYDGGDGDKGVSIVLPTMDLTSENSATMTVQEFHDNLGIEIGDQITFVMAYPVNNGERISSGLAPVQYQYSFTYARLIFAANSGSQKLFTSGQITPAALAPESQNASRLSLTLNGDGFLFKAEDISVTMDELVGVGVIISRRTGTDWQRSTQMMVTNEDSVSQEYTDADMLPSYLPTGEKYLNNASV